MKRIVLAAAVVALTGCIENQKVEHSEKNDAVLYTAFGLSDIDPGCELNTSYATINQKQYDDKGHSISVLEFKKTGGKIFAASMSYEGLGNADSSNLTSAIQVGDQVLVRYSVCGSGGYSTVIDLIKRW
ncbi:hypothetical protein [Aeromonas hydrophila]|uniref:hypothetical protein n=1 Tax=Aeromonas hydrophila TaxID=644 RepID=UPI00235EEA7C|nr:hypothetical protein [Aeromonas hydrophila]